MVSKEFFAEPAEEVARKLLGCIVIKDGMKGRIVESEAYLEDDPASHAYPRKTGRNRLMYETYGNIYVYICYGIHHMLNFTADEKKAGGVLIRGIEPLEGIKEMKSNRGVEDEEKLCSGPGRICEAFEISKEENGTEVGEEIELEKGSAPDHRVSTRVGINRAEDRELRYFVPGNRHVSRR